MRDRRKNHRRHATAVSYTHLDTYNYTQPSHDITLNGVPQKTRQRDITYTQAEAEQLASQILYPKYNDPELGLSLIHIYLPPPSGVDTLDVYPIFVSIHAGFRAF